MNFLVNIVRGLIALLGGILLAGAVLGILMLVTISAPILGILILVLIFAGGLYLEISERDP